MMAFVKGTLSDEQRQRIEANRRRALERLQKKGKYAGPVVSAIDTTIVAENRPSAAAATGTAGADTKRPRVELTAEQKKRIEENRQKALELRARAQQNNRDATNTKPEPVAVPHVTTNGPQNDSKHTRPSINRKDYIEYDFSTMKDTHGGFVDDEDLQAPDATTDSKTLEEWKEKQKREHVVKELAPPMDLSSAPRCFECNSLEIDPNMYSNFRQVRVCRKCIKEKPEKYSLLTKTECREDYLLTEPELRDEGILARIEKPNPHGFSRMQLFLRFQVEEFAAKKWGSLENVDAEWQKREENRLKRKEKKYREKLKEMRKKTRAEEYTRKLRHGEALGARHVHEWRPVATATNADGVATTTKRCIDCGMETEEMSI